jgi:hypothetical protein
VAYQDATQRLATTESERAALDSAAREAQRRVRQLGASYLTDSPRLPLTPPAEEDADLRANFVAAVCRQLHEPPQGPGSPSRFGMGTPHAATLSGRSDWATLQATLSEQTSLVVAERDALRRLRSELGDRLAEAQARLSATQAELQSAWQQALCVCHLLALCLSVIAYRCGCFSPVAGSSSSSKSRRMHTAWTSCAATATASAWSRSRS